MKNRFYIVFSLAFILAACESEGPTINNANARTENIFATLKVGSSSTYIAFRGDQTLTPWDINNISYSADTLSVSILEEKSNGYVVEERIHEGSENFQALADRFGGAVRQYLVQKKGDGWEVSDLDGRETITSVALGTGVPFSNEDENNSNLSISIQGKSYEQLNASLYTSGMAFDALGEFAIYASDAGLLRIGTIGTWIPGVNGWDYVEKAGE